MDICHECGGEYEKIGTHWSLGACEYPSFTDRQREIITGFVMSDASINRNGKNPHIQSNMITKEFLEWIDEEMGIFGKGVLFCRSAEECAKENRDRGFRPNADAKNYHDQYRWNSMRHPELHEFAAWYDSGKKVWPESVKFTPLSLKVFFCGDGYFRNDKHFKHISFGILNERDNKEKIEKLFECVGLSGTWDESESSCGYRLNNEQSQKAFEIMGDPLPGFEYKWPDE